MSRRPAKRKSNLSRRSRKQKNSIARFWPNAKRRKRWWQIYRKLSPWTQVFVGFAAIGALWLTTNWLYQVIRKPTELFFPVSGVLYKSPQATWEAYGTIFRRHSTDTISPELLAALAQVEGSGNPIVRTYWRWSFTHKPFEVYRPASSAVGMYQITDGTFDFAKRFCVHNHVVVQDGPWNDWRSCWFNSLYSRVVPTNAVEMTSAYLDRQVASILTTQHALSIAPQTKYELATLIHLCGAGAGASYAARGFRLTEGQRCGDHEAAVYIRKVNALRAQFARMNRDD
jgi:hypothetical protein